MKKGSIKIYKKKQKKQLVGFHSPKILVIFLVLLLILIPLSLFVITTSHSQNTKSVMETPKTIVKKLPAEITKQLREASPSAQLRVPILLYHYVEYVQDKKDTIRQSLDIIPYIFEQQVKTLVDAGYTFMTAKELGDVFDGNMDLPEKPVLLTFDDGHWDFYTDILPILEKYHVKATAYIIPGFLGGSDFMTQKQLQAVVDSGLVDVGAHTVHHISLKGKSISQVHYEVDTSKTMLEQMYHLHVASFAYPNGSFDEQAAKIVQDAGFTTAVSTVPELNKANRIGIFFSDFAQEEEPEKCFSNGSSNPPSDHINLSMIFE